MLNVKSIRLSKIHPFQPQSNEKLLQGYCRNSINMLFKHHNNNHFRHKCNLKWDIIPHIIYCHGSKHVIWNQKGHQMLDIINQNQTLIFYII